MLVISMCTHESTTLYDENGQELGKIRILSMQGNKAKVAFDMSNHIAVARQGLSKEAAINLLTRKNNENINRQ